MTGHPSVADRLTDLFRPTPRGVVGLVDDLLALCRGGSLRFDYLDGRCRVGLFGAGGQDAVDVPVPKAVFRAVLARVAALCNQRIPDSVTPYRGEGELTDTADLHAFYRAAFTNTPDEQWLELTHAGVHPNGDDRAGSA